MSLMLTGVSRKNAVAGNLVMPVLAAAGSSTVLVNNATRYLGLANGYSGTAASATEANVSVKMPCAGTMSRLYVGLNVPITNAATWTFTVRKNGADTALTLTLSSADATGEKVDASNSVSFAAGDVISIASVPSGTPDTQTAPTQVSLRFASDSAAGFISAVGLSVTAGSTVYIAPSSRATPTATETDHQVVVPTGGTLNRLNVTATSAPGTGETFTFTLRKNGADTVLTETISGTNTTVASPANNPVTVAAGDLICIAIAGSAAAATAVVKISLEWTPTTAGESIHFVRATSLSNTTAQYLNANGFSNNNPTENLHYNIAPVDFTAKKLYVDLVTAPSSGRSREFAFRVNGSSSALTATVSNAALTANDTSNTVSVSAGDQINFMQTPTGTPTSSGRYAASFVATVP